MRRGAEGSIFRITMTITVTVTVRVQFHFGFRFSRGKYHGGLDLYVSMGQEVREKGGGEGGRPGGKKAGHCRIYIHTMINILRKVFFVT